MDLTTWLQAEKGRAAALAAHFGKTPAAVSQWKTNGVPVSLMKAVRDFTKGAVTLEEMVPEAQQPRSEPSEAPAAAAEARVGLPEVDRAAAERFERFLSNRERAPRDSKPR